MNKTKQTNKQHMRTRKTTYVMMLIIIMVWTLVLFTHAFDHAYATQIDSNPHLRVSAEGQNDGNVIASTNIVEIVVIDELTNSDDRMPTVRVDGELFTMYFHSGAWYGYFADDGILDTGLANNQRRILLFKMHRTPTTSNLVALLDLM